MIMQRLSEQLATLSGYLKGSINLLIVDDFPVMQKSIVDLFSSPLFKISTAASACEARTSINSNKLWHCWVLDISMEEKYSGINLLSEYQQYPFAVILSGLRSMSVASRAMELGAYKVFDKDPQLLPVLHKEVCKLSAISYILNGAGTKYLSLFSLLAQIKIDSTETWASNAFMTVRQLERICSMHSHLTPRFLIPLYYTLELLLQIERPENIPENDPLVTKNFDSCGQHVDFVCRHIDTILSR
jgi:CheY-like chemotaxis protein